MRWLWSRRWAFARLSIAAVLVLVLLGDTRQRLAVMLMASLPTHDHAAEARELLARGRYADALLTIDAGIEIAVADAAAAADGPSAGDPIRRLEKLRVIRAEIERERTGVLRRASDFARGAITGGSNPENASIEALAGAVITDLFIVGDVRDLVIQGGKALMDGPAAADPVIVALSTVGIVTTLAPEIDWAPSLLKLARRSGTMSRELGEAILAASRAGNARGVARIAEEAGGLALTIGPGPAMRILALARSAEDLSMLRAFITRGGARAAVALRHAGEPGVDLLRAAARTGPDQLRAVEAGMLASARAGPRGLWLFAKFAPSLARPHLLVGLGKALYKGTGWNALQRAIEALRPWHWWLLPMAVAWLAVEFVGVVTAWRARPRKSGKSVEALGPSGI